MKPFNLKEYLKNPSRKVVTRDGRNVKRILCTDARNIYPVAALVESHDGIRDNVFQYTKDGGYFAYEDTDADLFFTTEKYEGWINIDDHDLRETGKFTEL